MLVESENVLSRFLLNKLIRSSGIPVFAPFYHTVSDVKLKHIQHLHTYLDQKSFKEHLSRMKEQFRFVLPNELNEASKNKRIPAILSFDDGLIECYKVVKPILLEMDIKALFFVLPSFVDGRDIFYRYKVSLILDKLDQSGNEKYLGSIEKMLIEKGKMKESVRTSLHELRYADVGLINELLESLEIEVNNQEIYMTSEMITSLKEDGHMIGAHSMDHPHFADLTKEEQLYQIKTSLDYVQNAFDMGHRFFAFPYYDFDLDPSLYDLMKKELSVDLSFGTSGIKLDEIPNSIQRLDMESGPEDADRALNRAFMAYHAKRLLNRHKLKRA